MISLISCTTRLTEHHPTTGAPTPIPLQQAKPLISAYVYGPVIGFDNPEASGFVGHGRRDAFGAVSLDDGETWKVTNLSNSADDSSFDLTVPVPDPADPACHQTTESAPAAAVAEVQAVEGAPVIEEAVWTEVNNNVGRLTVAGATEPRALVEILDLEGNLIVRTFANLSGEFDVARFVFIDKAACEVVAVVDDVSSDPVPVEGTPAECDTGGDECTLLTEYPGDVINIFHAVADNKVIAAWPSRFCTGGSPVFGDTFPRDEVAGYLGIDNAVDLYLTDMFGVGGNQSSVNYVDNEPVGEVPYSCLWSARGVLREDPENLGTTEVVWFQAERLTSGRRDVNRVETSCVAGAGCAITWQEDPEGTRPGEGEGPGTGWSGATTASKTDIWYSFIEWEDFDIIADETSGEPVPLADLILATGRPKPYVPMMTAVRLTNNDRCKAPVAEDDLSFCNNVLAAAYGIKNQCVGTVEVPLGKNGDLQPICVVDSNESGEMDAGDLPNLANNAASRPRLNLQPRKNADGVVDDAWVIVVSEEDKGLGRYGFLNDEEWTLGDLNDVALDTCEDPPNNPDDFGCQKADIGKNVFWASFNLGSPATSAGIGVDYSLVSNVLSQGAQLNQPEVNWRTGVYYPPMSTAQMWNFATDNVDLNYLIFNTEIARRTSLMSQPWAKATKNGTKDGLVAMPLWKQGTVNQGGPADISTRRFVWAVNSGGEDCPIEVDADQPVITRAEYRLTNGGPRVFIAGTGADLDADTPIVVRNAVTQDPFGGRKASNADGTFSFAIVADPNAVPCSVQAADFDGSLEWGPWVAVDTSALPDGVSCVDEVPAACNMSTSALAGLDETMANPYDAANMVCAWYDGEGNETKGVMYFDPKDPENTGGLNPYYPNGLCMAAPINLSARTPYKCEASGDSEGDCPSAGDMTCVNDESFGQLCSSLTNPEDNQLLDKQVSWYECPGWLGTNNSGDQPTIPGVCGSEPDSALLLSNMDDQSWYNPMEVSKAHRGFIDGDYIAMIYAWSPNWKQNKDGRDRYELYTRRSFDGGVTWTTTPANFAG